MPAWSGDAGGFSDYFRYTVGPELTGADKASLAAELGVDVRTVQRWSTGAGEQRDVIPSQYTGVPYEDLPESIKRRIVLIEALEGDLSQEVESDIPTEGFRECFESLGDALRYSEALADKSLDPWLDDYWTNASLAREGDTWCIHVEYVRYRRQGQAA